MGVGRTHTVDHPVFAHRSRDQARIAERTDPQRAVEALAREFDASIGAADFNLDAGMRGEKLQQPRHDDIARHGEWHVHTKAPGHRTFAAKKRREFLEIGDKIAPAFAPGAIETDFGGGAVRDNRDMNAFVAAQTAMGRAGRPDDVGGAIAALVETENGWITGQRIEASGGLFL